MSLLIGRELKHPDNLIYLHVPKTGGHWVRKACIDLDILISDTHRDHSYLSEFSEREYERQVRKFAFVRHPLTFWQSYFAYQMDIGWEGIPGDEYVNLRRFNTSNFEKFVKDVYKSYPSYVTELYRRYTDGDIVVGRQENLESDFISILKLFGFDCNFSILNNTLRQNVERSRFPEYSDSLMEFVLNQEQHAIDLFYSDNDLIKNPDFSGFKKSQIERAVDNYYGNLAN